MLESKNETLISLSDIKNLAERFSTLHESLKKYSEKFPSEKSEELVKLANVACLKFYNEVLDPCGKLQKNIEKARGAIENAEKMSGTLL